MVDAFFRGQIGGGVGAQGDEGLQIVADDFCGDVLGHGLLGQSGDMLQIEPVLEPFERLLDAPALVVKLGETVGLLAPEEPTGPPIRGTFLPTRSLAG